jgi:hypothetical protein
VKEAVAAKKIRKYPTDKAVPLLFEATVGFTHPKLVVQHLSEKREPLLKLTIDVILEGLK